MQPRGRPLRSRWPPAIRLLSNRIARVWEVVKRGGVKFVFRCVRVLLDREPTLAMGRPVDI